MDARNARKRRSGGSGRRSGRIAGEIGTGTGNGRENGSGEIRGRWRS
jgi:hypothetical protein